MTAVRQCGNSAASWIAIRRDGAGACSPRRKFQIWSGGVERRNSNGVCSIIVASRDRFARAELVWRDPVELLGKRVVAQDHEAAVATQVVGEARQRPARKTLAPQPVPQPLHY